MEHVSEPMERVVRAVEPVRRVCAACGIPTVQVDRCGACQRSGYEPLILPGFEAPTPRFGAAA